MLPHKHKSHKHKHSHKDENTKHKDENTKHKDENTKHKDVKDHKAVEDSLPKRPRSATFNATSVLALMPLSDIAEQL